jgi:hypothetical protein
MTETDYNYNIFIEETSPRASQPAKIKLPLKPHQLASLQKVITMENTGCIKYDVQNPGVYTYRGIHNTNNRFTTEELNSQMQFKGRFKIQSNVGVLGDAIGSGKTILALSIAASQTRDIHKRKDFIHSHHGPNGAYMRAIMDVEDEENVKMIKTTLIVTPRGPVYSQFIESIQKDTTLKVLCLDSILGIRKHMPPPTTSNADLKTFLETFDAVLIKNTALASLTDYYLYNGATRITREYNPFDEWDRIIVDEACDILNKITYFKYNFLWMISATYYGLLNMSYTSRNHLGYTIREVIHNEEILNLILVKCSDEFIVKSFNVPPPIMQYHICELPRQYAAVHSFLSRDVRERVDANDFMGALTLLGASSETETDIVKIVTKEIERDISNKKREIAYIDSLDIPDENKTARLVTHNAELARLEDKLKSLIERVTALEEKSCSVCLDALSNPLLLPCNHVFCTSCLIPWMQHNHNTCPECRSTIELRQLVAIVKDKNEEEASRPSSLASSIASLNDEEIDDNNIPTTPRPFATVGSRNNLREAGASSQPTQPTQVYSKEDTLVNIIQANPEGKFVVFSKLDSSYWGCMNRLRTENVSYSLLRGNSNVMASVLDRFKQGYTRVLLLNTLHAASGIDISCATDLIIVHDLGAGRTQAVGRCNRHPRDTALRIHQLCYPHEINS